MFLLFRSKKLVQLFNYFRKWNNWLLNEPKTYTKAGNMRSPGYARVMQWIAESWAELDCNAIARSFDNCGITSNNLADYHHQLRHFVRTNEFVDDVVPEEPSDEWRTFSNGDESDFDSDDETILIDGDESDESALHED